MDRWNGFVRQGGLNRAGAGCHIDFDDHGRIWKCLGAGFRCMKKWDYVQRPLVLVVVGSPDH
jgi:hypothetical protein